MRTSIQSILALLSVLTASCQGNTIHQATNDGDAAPAPQVVVHNAVVPPTSVSVDPLAKPPHQFVFKMDSYPIRADDWEALIKTLPLDDAAYLEAQNDRYFGVFAYRSAQELQALTTQGFPLPGEWLAARQMSDQELEELADTGNLKAKAFYLDRLLERAAPYLPLRGKDDAAFSQGPGSQLAMQAAERAMQIQSSYSGPFAGYQLGYAYAALSYPSSPEPAAAGMFLAMERGDRRAVQYLQAYQRAHPNMDLATVMAAYQSFSVPAR